MSYGRGGAGNILAAASQKITDDIEAQRSRAEQASKLPAIASNPPTSSTPANINQDYAHMGRGGAGNWYEPKELAKTGTFETSPEQTSIAGPPVDREVVSDTRRRGRGGAGNFVYEEEDQGAKQKKEEMEIELKDMVAKDVEAGLARPGRAYVRQEAGEH